MQLAELSLLAPFCRWVPPRRPLRSWPPSPYWLQASISLEDSGLPRGCSECSERICDELPNGFSRLYRCVDFVHSEPGWPESPGECEKRQPLRYRRHGFSDRRDVNGLHPCESWSGFGRHGDWGRCRECVSKPCANDGHAAARGNTAQLCRPCGGARRFRILSGDRYGFIGRRKGCP